MLLDITKEKPVDVGNHCNMDMPTLNEDIARVVVMSVEEVQYVHFTVRPLHLVLTAAAGLAIALILGKTRRLRLNQANQVLHGLCLSCQTFVTNTTII